MIITTTFHIENKPVQEYKGIVFGEVVEGRNFVKDSCLVFATSLVAVVAVMKIL